MDANPGLAAAERRNMSHPPYVLNEEERSAVLNAMKEVCLHRGWQIRAAHVRTNHVHIVVEAEARPERVMNDFKSYASRRLNDATPGGQIQKRWARHGSTRWLWTDRDVQEAIHYVLEEQGEPMAIFALEKFCPIDRSLTVAAQ